MTVTKFSTPLPWPNFLSASAAQLPSLSTQTGNCSASEIGVRRSTEHHSWISFVEWRTTPSCGFTRPPVDTPEKKSLYLKQLRDASFKNVCVSALWFSHNVYQECECVCVFIPTPSILQLRLTASRMASVHIFNIRCILASKVFGFGCVYFLIILPWNRRE